MAYDGKRMKEGLRCAILFISGFVILFEGGFKCILFTARLG